MTKKQMKNNILSMEMKYSRLLWYARKSQEHIDTIPGVKEEAMDIEKEYPEETKRLNSKEYGLWQHGFHSGMVAAMRYLLTLEEEGQEEADEQFPELDS